MHRIIIMGNEMISSKFNGALKATQVLHCNGQLPKRVGMPPRLTVRSCAVLAQKDFLLCLAGWSQPEISRALAVPQQSISRWLIAGIDIANTNNPLSIVGNNAKHGLTNNHHQPITLFPCRYAEIKLRAERRAGEMLREQVSPGNPQFLHDERIVPLKDLGISESQSHRWQTEASLPEEDFEKPL